MQQETNNKSKKIRLTLLCLAIISVGFFFFCRLYYVQVVKAGEYKKQAEGQYFIPYSSLFDRGSIYFTTKDKQNWLAASIKDTYQVLINPNLIENPESAYEKINSVLTLDKEEFMRKFDNLTGRKKELFQKISKEQTEKLLALEINGLSVSKNQSRFYPGKNLASHLIGFLSYKGDQIVATYGLERQYNDVLSHTKEEAIARNFFIEIFSEFEDKIIKKEKMKGSIVTGIEPSVQSFLEKKLDEVRLRWSAEKVGGVVIDPKTGQIYALAISPTFDLNNFSQAESSLVFSNSIIEEPYELGSIVKPITMAIGLDTGVITPETTYIDTGSVTLNDRTFSNFDKKARGLVNMQTVLDKSLNTGAAFVASKIGNLKFEEYLNKLFGEKTGIDLPNEGSSLIENLKSGLDIEFASASFGQGIALTPIGTIRALSALANGGYLVRPHIVNKIEFQTGFSKDIVEKPKERIFKQETSEEISRMLSKAFDQALLDGKYKMDHYSIAAKTGTAQIANQDSGGYYGDRFLHSFFGYFPAFDSKFLVFLYMYDPKGVDFASQTLASPFVDITSFLINSYEIPPDR